MAKKSNSSEIKAMSFEDALSELESIVSTLEQGTNKLDDAIKAYERGTLLKQHCEAKLEEAKERVEKISVNISGETTTEPIEFE